MILRAEQSRAEQSRAEQSREASLSQELPNIEKKCRKTHRVFCSGKKLSNVGGNGVSHILCPFIVNCIA
jgi:hypothetical protein